MIRTFLDLSVKAGHAEQLAATFRRLGILDESVAQPGCRSAELTVSADGHTATVTATWESPDAYDAWTSRRDRGDLAEHLSVHLERPLDAATVGRVHQVLLQGGPTMRVSGAPAERTSTGGLRGRGTQSKESQG